MSFESSKAPSNLVLALDIGGSSVKHGVAEIPHLGDVSLLRVETENLPSLVFSDLKQIVLQVVGARLQEEPRIQSVGISTTGSVDRSGVVVSAGHFDGYKDVNWFDILHQEFPSLTRVITTNDGRASAWAEFSTKSDLHRSLIHTVVGTGVGGGIVYDGDLVLGDSGQAGYIGHIKVTDSPTATCSCGSSGCVEALSAAPAIVRRFNEHNSSDVHVVALAEVASAASSGSADAVQAFEEAGRWLGIGLGDAMNVLNPSVVTVGGGVLLASEGIFALGDGGPFFTGVSEGVDRAAHRRVASSGHLELARLGNDGGLIGAALLAVGRKT